MLARQGTLPSALGREQPFSRIHWIAIAVVVIALIAVATGAFLVVRGQGLSQGLITLTILSIVVGMMIGLLTLLVNFFQWLASTPQASTPIQTSSRDEAASSISIQPQSALVTVSPRPEKQPAGERGDWGEAPNVTPCYGRDQELHTLKQWIVADRCQVVTIAGLGGAGKTTLASTLARQLSAEFEGVFWCSLHNAPPLINVLEKCISLISNQQRVELPADGDARIALLLTLLRTHRCLLIFDNLESLLQAGKHAGSYQEGYEDFGKLIERLGEAQHQSCLLLTSREKPRALTRLEGGSRPVRTLHLPGLAQAASQQMLQPEGLFGTDETWQTFISLHSGNPLAMKLSAEPIRELFRGDIAAFLAQQETIAGELQDLLAGQFQRLSPLEQELLYWLAIERDLVPLDTLRANIMHPIPKGELLEALKSLRRRSMIEIGNDAHFTLQPAIMEYVTDRLVALGLAELKAGTFDLLRHHALLKAQAADYVRASQKRFILAPLAASLRTLWGQAASENRLHQLLDSLRESDEQASSYVGGNLLNLLIHLGCDLRGMDLSRLAVWQAYLQGVTLPDVDFTNADLTGCSFTETFGNILSTAIDGEGRLLAAGTSNGEVELWQLPGGTPLLTLTGHSDWIRSIAFSPAGTCLATGSDDQTIRLWDGQTGRCLRTLHSRGGRTYAVAFHPTADILASGGDDQAIHLWDIQTRQHLTTLQGHHGKVRALAFSPDNHILASGSTDQSIRLWDSATGECLRTLQGHNAAVYCLAFSPDGRTIVSGGDDQNICLWDVATGCSTALLQGHAGCVRSLAFNAAGSQFISAGDDRTVRLWDSASGRCLKTLQGHNNRVRSAAISPNGALLVSGSDDQTLRLWSTNSGDCLKTLRGHNPWIHAIAFSPDGTFLAHGSDDRGVRLWDTRTEGSRMFAVDRAEDSNWVYALAFSSDGKILASGNDNRSVRLWDCATGQQLTSLQGHSGRVRALAFQPSGALLASGSDDQTLRLWNTNSGGCLKTLTGHTGRVRALAFSPDGALLVSGGDDQTLRLWEVESGRCLSVLQTDGGTIWSVAFDTTGRFLASGSDDQALRLWDRQTGTVRQTLYGHTGRIYTLAFSPTANLIASGSEDHTARLWDRQTGQCLVVLQGHTSRIRAVAFHPDGQSLATGSHDGTLRLWESATGAYRQTLRGDRPYERMRVQGVKGITRAQKAALQALGAIES